MQGANQMDQNVEVGLNYFDAFFDHGYGFNDVRQNVLPSVNVQGALSRYETRDRLEERLREIDSEELDRHCELIKLKLVSFILYNSKVVSVLGYSTAEALSIVDAFKHDLSTGNVFSQNFPCLPDLSLVGNSAFYPAAYLKVDGKYVLCFGSKRTVSENIDIPIAELNPDARQKYHNLYKIRAQRLDEVAGYDLAVIDPSTGYCEVRISDSRKLNISSLDEISTLFFKKIKSLSSTRRFVDMKNFHPAISHLYDERGDGSRVTQFYFETDEDGVKRETVRYNRSDLRSEEYHGAGSLAINYQFRVFAIRKHWHDADNDSLNNVGVVVEGSSRILNHPQPEILRIKVLDCFDASGYNFVMSKVLPYMV